MRYGLFAFPQSINRTELCNEVKCLPQVSDEERQSLIQSLKIETYFSIGGRLAIFPFFIYLYKIKFFDKKVSMFKREIPLVFGGLIFTSFVDQLGSQLMWKYNQKIVEKYKQNPQDQFKKKKIVPEDLKKNDTENERFYDDD